MTALGLALALAAVVVLTGVAANFERAFLAIYESREIDLIVVRAGIGNQLSSTLDESLAERLRTIEGVAAVDRSLMDTFSFEEANLAAVLANGWESGGLLTESLRVIEGRMLKPGDTNAVLLGRVLALNLDKNANEQLDIFGQPFDVVGVFESDSLFENGGLVMPLETLQRMMGREGQVTGFVIRSEERGARAIDALRRRIEAEIGGVAATPARDYVQSDIQIRLAKSMSWVTTAVALALGSLGMLNTMMMAVFERTREIGVLRALGWRRSRVMRLIVGEALILGGLGSLIGLFLGALGTVALSRVPTARGFIAPNLPLGSVVLALLLGLLLSFLGGLYPAARAARLDPTEALRSE